jgi:hypothetical protein
METSGALRRRFQALGHDVVSCDILPAEDDARGHIQGDVFEVLEELRWPYGWWPDLAMFHITCTYLTNSAAWAYKDPDYDRYPGVGYHQRLKPGTLFGAARREARERSLNEFRYVLKLPIARKIVENPIGALSQIRKPTQIVQPYQFGDDASKGTCFWYIGPNGEELRDMRIPIDPSKRIAGRLVDGREYWANQTDTGQNRLSPGDERWKDRSRTFPGIADALVFHLHKLSVLTTNTNNQEDIFS